MTDAADPVASLDPTASLGIALGEEQVMLDRTLERLFARTYSFADRRQHQSGPEGFSRDVWLQLADLGVLGLPFDEELGGTGGGPAELLVVMRAIGQSLALEPYLSTVVHAGGLVRRLASDEQRQEILPPLIAGKLILSVALEERQIDGVPAHAATVARPDGSGYQLDGSKTAVLFGAQADRIIVRATVEGETGIGLFLVDRDAKGLSVRDYPTADGLRAADLLFDGVAVGLGNRLGAGREAETELEAATDLAVAALAAEGVGCMDRLLADTIEHMKTRRQFSRPIAQFQALRHRLADMAIHREQARSLAERALVDAWSGAAEARRRSVSAAKIQIGRSGRFVAQSAVQIFGGLGVTMDLPAAHYAKRLTMMEAWLGDSATHLRRFLLHSSAL